MVLDRAVADDIACICQIWTSRGRPCMAKWLHSTRGRVLYASHALKGTLYRQNYYATTAFELGITELVLETCPANETAATPNFNMYIFIMFGI